MQSLKTAFLLLALASAPLARAHTLHAVANAKGAGKSTVGLSFLTSRPKFETQAGTNFRMDRKVFGLDADVGLGNDTSVFGSLGRIMSTEFDEFREFNGEGFLFGMGAKTVALRGAKANIIPYGQFTYLIEDLSYKPSDAAQKEVHGSNSLYDFVIGCQFALNANPHFSTYAGIELFPLNEGEFEFKAEPPKLSLAGSDLNFKRVTKYRKRDVLDLKFGALANFDRFLVRGEVTMIAETTFLFGAGFTL